MSRDVVLIHGTSATGAIWDDLRAFFEGRGWNVHTPALRHHDPDLARQPDLVAGVSLRGFAEDLVAYVRGIGGEPLIGGHSLGGLVAQLVAARTPSSGLLLLAPAPAPGMLPSLSSVRTFAPHFLHPTPWRRPLAPLGWRAFRRAVVNAQDEGTGRRLHGLVQLADSGRAYCEMAFPLLDRHHAARVDYARVTGPVLVVGGTEDRLISTRIGRATAARHRDGTFVAIDGADHMLPSGRFLPQVERHIDAWIGA
jgi:pimeloyl-ACP methyl ester carboxylesterase